MWTEISRKRSRKEIKPHEFRCRDKTNVEHETYDCTGNKWNHQNSKKRFKEKSKNNARKIVNIFTTKDSNTGNVIRNKEGTAV